MLPARPRTVSQTLGAIHNEVSTEKVRTVSGRTSDSVLSMVCRARLRDNENIDHDKIELVVDAGVAYLLGVVTKSEGAEAAEAIRYVRGLKEVIKVFAYVD